MHTLRVRLTVALTALGIIAFAGSESVAQIATKPYGHNSAGSGSLGMSVAGKQAIINQELFGATPRVLLKSQDGRLLVGPVRGPGRSAIVFSPSGEILPGYRRDFRRGKRGLGVGAFNAFFVPRGGSGRSSGYVPTAAPSDALVNTWTTRVVTDSGVGYGPATAVEQWTGAVYGLGPARTF